MIDSFTSNFKKTISKIYYTFPFLHEINALTDWTSQNTFLTYSQWLHLSQIKHLFSLQDRTSSYSSFLRFALKLAIIIVFFGVFLAPCFLLSTYGIWLPTSYDINVETILNLQAASNHIKLFQNHRHFWTQSVEKTQFDQNNLPSIFNEENVNQAQVILLISSFS